MSYDNILAIGASKNIGYYAALRLLRLGSSVTFLLRNPSIFDGNEEIAPFIQSGKAILIKGDALKQEEIKSAWDATSAHGHIDVVLFTVGGTPSFSLRRGFYITPANLVTQCLLNLLCIIPSDLSAPPKLVVITSMGVTHASHQHVPALLKPVHTYLLAAPFRDKFGVERVIAHCTGRAWEDREPGEDIMGAKWREREGLPVGALRNVMVVRPALLTFGECKADTAGESAYRVSEGDISGWTISRKDVAHFVVDAVTKRWDEFGDKTITITY